MAAMRILLANSLPWEANQSSATAPERPTWTSRSLANGFVFPLASRGGRVWSTTPVIIRFLWGPEWRQTCSSSPRASTLAWSLISLRRSWRGPSMAFHKVRHPTWRSRARAEMTTSRVRSWFTAQVMARVVKCLAGVEPTASLPPTRPGGRSVACTARCAWTTRGGRGPRRHRCRGGDVVGDHPPQPGPHRRGRALPQGRSRRSDAGPQVSGPHA